MSRYLILDYRQTKVYGSLESTSGHGDIHERITRIQKGVIPDEQELVRKIGDGGYSVVCVDGKLGYECLLIHPNMTIGWGSLHPVHIRERRMMTIQIPKPPVQVVSAPVPPPQIPEVKKPVPPVVAPVAPKPAAEIKPKEVVIAQPAKPAKPVKPAQQVKPTAPVIKPKHKRKEV